MEHGFLGPFALAVALGAPLLLGLAGFAFAGRQPHEQTGANAWDWRLLVRSSLLYTLAFNLTFFLQELFLVVPKALTPGLRPTLYHNNHNWEGSHPLESLFQGTGALAILLSGLIFALLVHKRAGRSPNVRLFFLWMAYSGLFQSLPQIVVGALNPGNDVGMAMDYFAMSQAAKTAAALLALAAIAASGLWLSRPFLEQATRGAALGSAKARIGFIFNAATAPALLALPLIIAFRVPREAAEVLSPPIAVMLVGVSWIQANAWRVADARPTGAAEAGGIRAPLILTLILLGIFQIVLRPGIPFY